MVYTNGWSSSSPINSTLHNSNRYLQGVNSNLIETLTSNNLSSQLDPLILNYWKKNEKKRPIRTYVSLGTHSTTMNNRGSKASISILFNSTPPTHFLSDPSIRFLPTTPVNVAYVPTGWIDQEILQNNVLIQTRNEWLYKVVEEKELKMIDLWGLLIGVWMDRMREKDAVHWSEQVYSMIGKILYSEMKEGENWG